MMDRAIYAFFIWSKGPVVKSLTSAKPGSTLEYFLSKCFSWINHTFFMLTKAYNIVKKHIVVIE